MNKVNNFAITINLNAMRNNEEKLKELLESIIIKLNITHSRQGQYKVKYRQKLRKELSDILNKIKNYEISLLNAKNEILKSINNYNTTKGKKWRNKDEIIKELNEITKFLNKKENKNLAIVGRSNSNHRTGKMSSEEKKAMNEILNKEREMDKRLEKILENLDILKLQAEMLGNELVKNIPSIENTSKKVNKSTKKLNKLTQETRKTTYEINPKSILNLPTS